MFEVGPQEILSFFGCQPKGQKTWLLPGRGQIAAHTVVDVVHHAISKFQNGARPEETAVERKNRMQYLISATHLVERCLQPFTCDLIKVGYRSFILSIFQGTGLFGFLQILLSIHALSFS